MTKPPRYFRAYVSHCNHDNETILTFDPAHLVCRPHKSFKGTKDERRKQVIEHLEHVSKNAIPYLMIHRVTQEEFGIPELYCNEEFSGTMILDAPAHMFPKRFSLHGANLEVYLRSYIPNDATHLERAALLLKFARKCTRIHKQEHIYVTQTARDIVHLPVVLTPEFFAKKKAK